jgi:hypothetical protein
MSSPGCSRLIVSSLLSLPPMNKKAERLICNGVGAAILLSTLAAGVALYCTGHHTGTSPSIRKIDGVEYEGTELKEL